MTNPESPAAAGDGVLQRLLAGVLRRVMRFTMDRSLTAALPVVEQRRRLVSATRLAVLPRGVAFTPGTCGGVPGEWVSARGPGDPGLTILYLHGGGYCTGSPATHRAITGRLARNCAARLFAADYRLAPEHPFPAALDDAVAAALGILESGTAPRDLVLAGDSAGGGLAVAAAVRLRELGLSATRALVLFSPWVDLQQEQLPAERPAGEVMLSRPFLEYCARAYAGSAGAGHPLVSPLGAALESLPPTLIQVGGDEYLRSDALRLKARLEQAAVDVRLEEYAGRWHVFQVNAGLLADADRALGAVAHFIRAAAPMYRE